MFGDIPLVLQVLRSLASVTNTYLFGRADNADFAKTMLNKFKKERGN